MFEPFKERKQISFGDIENNLPEKLKQQLYDGWPGMFNQHVFSEIDENKFSDMYDQNQGRPNFPVKILISLEILKHTLNISDKELLESFHFDTRFIVALSLQEVGQLTLGERTLYDFRERLIDYSNEHGYNPLSEIFDDLVDNFLDAADIDSDIQRMDSTMVEANIKHLSRIELMRKVFANFVDILSKSQKNRIHKNTMKILDDSQFNNYLNNFEYEEVIESLLGKLNNVKEHFKNHDEINQTKEYEHLCRIVEEQSIKTTKQLKAKDDNDIDSSSMQNPNDEDATFRQKGSKSSQGYSCNISETANPDNPVQMITDISVKPNICSDVKFLQQRINKINQKTELDKLIVDGAYYGSESKKKAQSNNTELIPTTLTGRTPEHSTAEFNIEKNKGIACCPIGIKPIKTKYLDGSDTYAAWFNKSDCKNCSYENCPIREQNKNMTVRFKYKRYKRDLLRNKLTSGKYEKLKKARPAIEGTFSALKRAQGLDKFKVTGLIKTSCSSMFKALGYNFKQFIKALKMKSKPVLTS